MCIIMSSNITSGLSSNRMLWALLLRVWGSYDHGLSNLTDSDLTLKIGKLSDKLLWFNYFIMEVTISNKANL